MKLFLLFIFFFSTAYATCPNNSNEICLSSGSSATITPNFSGARCHKVTNNTGKDLYIPTKTTEEWDANNQKSFVTKPPKGVTIATCAPRPPPIISCSTGTTTGTCTQIHTFLNLAAPARYSFDITIARRSGGLYWYPCNGGVMMYLNGQRVQVVPSGPPGCGSPHNALRFSNTARITIPLDLVPGSNTIQFCYGDRMGKRSSYSDSCTATKLSP